MKISKKIVGVLVGIIVSLIFAPSVKAQVIELTQADFAEADVPAKGIAYDYMEGEYILPGGEYKITEDITLPVADSKIYFHDADVTIDASGHTVKASFTFVDSDVKIIGGTFIGEENNGTMYFYDSNALIKNGTFKSNREASIYFNNLEPGVILYNPDTPLHDNNLIIENGNFESSSQAALKTFGGKQITIKNGTFTGSYAGIDISSYEKATIEKGKFKANFVAQDELTNPYEFKGAITIHDTTDTSKIGALLSENSKWDREVEVKDYNRHFVEDYGEYDIKAVYTQTEINVITLYQVLEGANQTYDKIGKDRLIFVFNTDYEVFKNSGKVYVDGALIDPSNYDSEEGSTIIVFTKAFTNKLDVGDHTIKITTDEGEAEATFNVINSVENPKTADNIVVYACLIIVALLGFAISRNEVFNKQN